MRARTLAFEVKAEEPLFLALPLLVYSREQIFHVPEALPVLRLPDHLRVDLVSTLHPKRHLHMPLRGVLHIVQLGFIAFET